MPDKRKHVRIKRPFVIYYHRCKGSDKIEVSQTEDLSLGGMRFVAAKPFEKDVMLQLELQSMISASSIKIRAQVLSSQAIGEGAGFETRVLFDESDAVGLLKLKREIQ
ncbi:PilZ domain-containing protein [Candidatus Omnitrophota bacterium]